MQVNLYRNKKNCTFANTIEPTVGGFTPIYYSNNSTSKNFTMSLIFFLFSKQNNFLILKT